jgi:hypothetical protein
MSSSTLPLSATENKRLAQCAREASKLLAQLFAIGHSGKESTSIIRQLRELLPQFAALTNVPPALREIIDAGPDGAGLGAHRPPASARWPEWRRQLHEAASAWLGSVARDAEGTPDDDAPRPAMLRIGECLYRLEGGEPVTVSKAEDKTLRSFLGKPAMSDAELNQAAGYNAARVLRALVARGHPLASAIRVPEGKGLGGYHVNVRRADP